jgi:hypothetical protein
MYLNDSNLVFAQKTNYCSQATKLLNGLALVISYETACKTEYTG